MLFRLGNRNYSRHVPLTFAEINEQRSFNFRTIGLFLIMIQTIILAWYKRISIELSIWKFYLTRVDFIKLWSHGGVEARRVNHSNKIIDSQIQSITKLEYNASNTGFFLVVFAYMIQALNVEDL
jgi:hypothetical protein